MSIENLIFTFSISYLKKKHYSILYNIYDMIMFLFYRKDADDILKAFRTKERFERSEETSAIVQAKVQ